MTGTGAPRRNAAAAAFRPDGPRGLRWAPELPTRDWAGAAAVAGWHRWVLDTATASDKAGFLTACAAAFALPDWFGHNWDALEECLGDLDVAPGALVVWTGWQGLRRRDPGTFATAVEVLGAAASSWHRAGAPALVVLVGGGADPGVPRWPAP